MSAHINDPKTSKKIIESKKIHVILKARSCYDNKLSVILKSIKNSNCFLKNIFNINTSK